MVERWHRALERVLSESVRVVRIGDVFYATSSSVPLGSHRLTHDSAGWKCDCIANALYGRPCKHLAALSTEIDIDLMNDVRLDWSRPVSVPSAA
jgi:hypothetical protein